MKHGPDEPDTATKPIAGTLETIMMNAIAAANWRIVARFIWMKVVIDSADSYNLYLTFGQRAIDVGSDRLRAHVERIVLAKLPAVGAD